MYAPIAANAAISAGIDPSIFTGLIGSESSWNPKAYNPTSVNGENATGIAQFLPSTAKGLNIDPNNPAEALPAAASYLKTLYDKFGNYPQAIAAYKGYSDTVTGAYSKQVQDVIQGAGYAPGSIVNMVGQKIADSIQGKTTVDQTVTPSINTDTGIDGIQSMPSTQDVLDKQAASPDKPIWQWGLSDWKDFFTTSAIGIVLFLSGLALILFTIYAIVTRGRQVPAQLQTLAKG